MTAPDDCGTCSDEPVASAWPVAKPHLHDQAALHAHPAGLAMSASFAPIIVAGRIDTSFLGGSRVVQPCSTVVLRC